jgi:hypothetical protein
MVVLGAGGFVVETESDAGAATIGAHQHTAARAAKRKHRKHKKKRRTRTPPPAQEM